MAMDTDAGRREFPIGDVYSRAYALMGGPAGGTIFAISFLLAAVPFALWGMARPSLIAAVPGVAWKSGAAFLVGIIPAIFQTIAQAVLVQVVMSGRDGGRVSVAQALGTSMAMVLPLIGLAILTWFAPMLGMILLLVPGVILTVIWSVASQALVAERSGVVPSLKRSSYLTKGVRWQVFGVVLLIGIVGIILAIVAALFVAGVGGGGFSLAALMRQQAVPSVVGVLVNLVTRTALIGFSGTLFGVLFVELRDWKDGLARGNLAEVFA